MTLHEPSDLARLAEHLRGPAAELETLGHRLGEHAPDAGQPPAPDAVATLVAEAALTLHALARGLTETTAALVESARRWNTAEELVARELGHLRKDQGQ